MYYKLQADYNKVLCLFPISEVIKVNIVHREDIYSAGQTSRPARCAGSPASRFGQAHERDRHVPGGEPCRFGKC